MIVCSIWLPAGALAVAGFACLFNLWCLVEIQRNNRKTLELLRRD
jgi:hypothetical protein